MISVQWFNAADAASNFSFLKPCLKTHRARGKDVHQLQKGQIIDLQQAKITTKEIETTEELSDALLKPGKPLGRAVEDSHHQ